MEKKNKVKQRQASPISKKKVSNPVNFIIYLANYTAVGMEQNNIHSPRLPTSAQEEISSTSCQHTKNKQNKLDSINKQAASNKEKS